MKTSPFILVALLTLSACQKDALIAIKSTPSTPPPPPPVVVAPVVNPDTIPDKAIFKIQLVKDSANYDETMFLFNKTSSLSYDANVDAAYFSGYGQESLASISKDGQDLAVYNLPYTPGMSIGLNVNTAADGKFSLGVSFEKNIPANTQIWLKDTYLKDSVNVRTGNYNFNVIKADANTFGSKRFKLIIKAGQQQTQTGTPH